MAVQQNKYLTFLLGDESYGIPIRKVKEIIGIMPVTHVPKMPDYVKGVINLRGKIIPVMDLRLKFGFDSRDYDDRTCIIVVEIEAASKGKLSGLLVDTVSEVIDIGQENIEAPPEFGGGEEQEFLTGMGKVKEKVVMLLDADKVLNDIEKAHIEKVEMEIEEVLV